MIDESGCYVQSVELGPPLQYPCEKMDICYNSPVNNTRGVAEGEAECTGDNKWEEEEEEEEEEEKDRRREEVDGDQDGKKSRHNRDNTSIVRATEEADASRGKVSGVGLPSSAPNAAGGKLFQIGRTKKNRCLPSRTSNKYGQRPRTIIRRLILEKGLRDRSTQKTPVQAKFQTLSKYRKKSMSAREWCHMQEINLAFESLRNALPMGYNNGGCSDTSAAAKMTTLRLALRYIATLTQLLQDDQVSQSTDDECQSSCCSGEHSYYTPSNSSSSSSNGSASDHSETVSYRDVGESHLRDLETQDKNSLSKSSCLDYNRHAQGSPLPHAYSSTHRTSLHHDRHKRPRYQTEKDYSHEALDSCGRPNPLLAFGKKGNGKEQKRGELEQEKGEEEEEKEVEEEEDSDNYIEAIAAIFKDPGNSFDADESGPFQKDVHLMRHKGSRPPLEGSVPHSKTRPLPHIMEGQGGDPCPAEDFGDLTDYHSESHLQVLDDLKQQLSDADSDALLLASNAGGSLSKDLT